MARVPVQDLANHAASLNSTRGAAFGFASIAKLAGEQLKPYVDKMIPRLYRCSPAPRRPSMVAVEQNIIPSIIAELCWLEGLSMHAVPLP